MIPNIMNLMPKFFKTQHILSVHLVLLVAAFFSFKNYIERLLFPTLGMGWAYVIDQSTPLIFSLLFLYFLLIRKKLKVYLVKLKPFYGLLIFLFLLAFITHLGILYNYFWADEPYLILKPVTQNESLLFHITKAPTLRGYFLSSYVVAYLLFATNNLVYQILSLTYFSISVLFVFWFVYLLTNRKLVATLAGVFFATTPAYLDIFTWQNSNYTPILILCLASMILLLYYKKTQKFVYYILSIMFFFASVKMGFLRSAGFAFIPILLLSAPIYKLPKLNIFKLISLALPFIVISIYFVIFEFLSVELNVAFAPLIQPLGLHDKLLHTLDNLHYLIFKYRDIDQNSSLFLPKLYFFSSFLFFPAGFASEILLRLRPLFQHTSLVYIMGKFTLLTLGSLLLLGLRFRKTKYGWLVMFAVLFVFINMLHFIVGYQASPEDFSPTFPGSLYKLDTRFALENSGYGPGSRYLLISSLGIGLLFALVVCWLSKKKGKKALISILFCLVVILGNSYFTIRAQVQNFKGMSLYRSLVEHIFEIVPRDGKPKILFSANPQFNGLDGKFGGWEWLLGFYKKEELVYAKDLTLFTNDQPDIKTLIKSGKYSRENLYAFYNNPQTLAYADVSQEARDYFFKNPSASVSREIEFENTKQESKMFDSDTGDINLIQRAILESADINQRYISTSKLKFKLKIQMFENPKFPISDSRLTNKTTQTFPLQLWGLISQPPKIDPSLEILKQESENNQKEIHRQLSGILQERQALREYTKISVSDTQNIAQMPPESLIDGLFTTFPNIPSSEEYYPASKNPVTITLSFSTRSAVKRILFNTPDSFSLPFSPQKITVLSAPDNQHFYQVTTIENLSPGKWSPNRGLMTAVDLPQTVYARSLKFVIVGKSQPVALDEVVVDGPIAAVYSPKDIYSTTQSVFSLVKSKESLEKLTEIKENNRLILFWACAEDVDWKHQLKDIGTVVPGIWHTATVNIQQKESLIEDSVKFNCYGSKLRKIFFASPPYPVNMEVVKAVIE